MGMLVKLLEVHAMLEGAVKAVTIIIAVTIYPVGLLSYKIVVPTS